MLGVGNVRLQKLTVSFLERANWLTSLDTVVWDSGWLLSEASIPGRALHTLIGYTDQPTQMQLLVYLAVLVVTFVLMRLIASERQGQAVAAS
jgi:high-affinity iron transporter